MPDYSEINQALQFLDPNCPREYWVNVAGGIKNALGPDGLELFDSWSQGGATYDTSAVKATFKSTNGCVPVEWIFKQAISNGFKPAEKTLTPAEKKARQKQETQQRAQRLQREQEERDLQQQWHTRVQRFCNETLLPRLVRAGNSKYLTSKKINAFEIYFVPNGLGVVLDSEKQSIDLLKGRDVCQPYFDKKNRPDHIWFAYFSRGTIAVPLSDEFGALHNFQFIFAAGKKTFIKHGRKKGLFHAFGDFSQGYPVVICEGYATACSCFMATGWPCVVAFDCGNLMPVAQVIGHQHPDAKIIIAGDDDADTEGNPGRTKAAEAAQAVGGVTVFPKFVRAVNG